MRRQRTAIQGEAQAELLLESQGYKVEHRQLSESWTLWVDGEPRKVRSRADLMVSKGGLSFIAEVKTGRRAPDPTIPATRRQLMEYHYVFPVAGVLLVDPAAGHVHHVRWEPP